MEVLAIIGVGFIIFIIIKFISSIIHSAKYSNFIQLMIEEMTTEKYLKSERRKENIERINEVGFSSYIFDLILNMRESVIKELKLNPSIFPHQTTRNDERKFIIAYAHNHDVKEKIVSLMSLDKTHRDILYPKLSESEENEFEKKNINI
jgi:hypothetical protein